MKRIIEIFFMVLGVIFLFVIFLQISLYIAFKTNSGESPREVMHYDCTIEGCCTTKIYEDKKS